MNKLEIIKQTRQIATNALYTVLKQTLQSKKTISEAGFRDAWLEEMRKNNNIFPNGWYDPPQHGMIILFADEKHVERFMYTSARPKEMWPRNDIFLDRKKGIIYCYASPVDKKTGIIGDFGISLYFGNKTEIKTLLKTCLELDQKVFEHVAIGAKISDVTHFAEKQMDTYGMNSEAVSITDKGITNIGHSIPASYEEWNNEEKKTLTNGLKTWNRVKDMIKNKRFFVTREEDFIVRGDCAFTIEPRPKVLNKPDLPATLSYHTIVLLKKDGTKELLTGFDKLFKLAGMDYMIKN